eukprot:scaffold176686_cov37-Prasinocladus_malaysianus.AAC.1
MHAAAIAAVAAGPTELHCSSLFSLEGNGPSIQDKRLSIYKVSRAVDTLSLQLGGAITHLSRRNGNRITHKVTQRKIW